MFRQLATLSFVALACTAPARAETAATRFDHKGVTYVYTTELRGPTRILRGVADGVPFRLVVYRGRVTGTYDLRPVSFALDDVRPLRLRASAAAR